LPSGALLLVKHGPLSEKVKRKKLLAVVSCDDGLTPSRHPGPDNNGRAWSLFVECLF
jgi:hypothetical protein